MQKYIMSSLNAFQHNSANDISTVAQFNTWSLNLCLALVHFNLFAIIITCWKTENARCLKLVVIFCSDQNSFSWLFTSPSHLFALTCGYKGNIYIFFSFLFFFNNILLPQMAQKNQLIKQMKMFLTLACIFRTG